MKTKIFILLILLFDSFLYSQQSGWIWQTPSYTNMGISDISIINSTTAYAIGGLSTFIKTTNAGLTWSNGITSSEFTGISPERLFGIFFINQNTGWVVGYNNAQPPLRIFKTTNAGATWFRQGENLINGYLQDIFFINENTGWIAGNNKILKTTNSGNEWIEIPLPNNSQMYAVYFQNENTGFLTGEYWTYRSTNGGLNWTTSYTYVNSMLYSIKFINENTGFLCGYQSNKARVIKTTNGGINWQVKYAANSDQLNALHIFSASEIIAVGGKYDGAEKIVYSNDGGEVWNDIYTDIPNKEILITTAFFDQNTGIAAGYDGKMIRTTDKGMNWSEVNPQNYRLRSTSVHFDNSQNGMVATENGKVFKTSNGGLTWDSLISPTNESIVDCYNFGSKIYLIGFNSFFRSTNNGSTWQNYPLGRNVYCSEFIDQNNGFIFGNISGQYWSFNTFFRTSNGGSSWDSVSIQDFPYAMKFINPQTGYIAGGNSGYNTYLSKTTNSGINWTKHNVSGIYKKAKSISFINENTGWIGCDENVLIKTTNGGLNFQVLNFGRPQSWTTPKVFFRDEYNGWAAVNNPSGQMLNTTNGGLNWHIQFDCGTAGISSFHFIDNNTGWCAGYGYILKTTNSGNFITGLIKNEELIPDIYGLSQNYPNPFNPVTNIKFDIPKSGLVKITVYDLLGREVATLVNEQMQPGSYNVDWDASNYPSGVYFYKLETEKFSESKKMVLVK